MLKYIEYTGKVPNFCMHIGAAKYPCMQINGKGDILQVAEVTNEVHQALVLKTYAFTRIFEVTKAAQAQIDEIMAEVQAKAELLAAKEKYQVARSRAEEAVNAAKAADIHVRNTLIIANQANEKAEDLNNKAEALILEFNEMEDPDPPAEKDDEPPAETEPSDPPAEKDDEPPAAPESTTTVEEPDKKEEDPKPPKTKGKK